MKELSMHYSFRNTLCGLAAIVAASLLAEQAAAQGTVALFEGDDTISLSDDLGIPEEISLLDETVVGVPSNGLISPLQPTNASNDVIPMEGASDINMEFEDTQMEDDIDITIEAPTPAPTKSLNTKSTVVPEMVAKGNLLGAPTQGFDENIVSPIDSELFSKMSDLEKQTTLLNLELKKERVANEIAAVKAQRLKAQQEEDARKEAEERKRIEWQNEQERLKIAEETKLKEAAAALEKLRQEKIVKAYKVTMLETTQKWIKKNAEVYAQVAKKNEEIKSINEDAKQKLSSLKQKAADLKSKAEVARVNYDKKVANLENQISILKTRLEAEIESGKQKLAAATTGGKKNPFAVDGKGAMPSEKIKLNSEYAIMEVVGQGDELAAKLINREGDVFLAKIGTTLKNGYTIDEISQTYLSAVKDNEKDFLYFSAGGALDHEPPSSDITIKDAAPIDPNNPEAFTANRSVNSTQGIPSLGRGMFIR